MPMAPTPLRLAIVHSGRRQREIADAAGLSESRLSLIVNGLHCNDATRLRIAAALGRDVSELFPPSARAEGEVA